MLRCVRKNMHQGENQFPPNANAFNSLFCFFFFLPPPFLLPCFLDAFHSRWLFPFACSTLTSFLDDFVSLSTDSGINSGDADDQVLVAVEDFAVDAICAALKSSIYLKAFAAESWFGHDKSRAGTNLKKSSSSPPNNKAVFSTYESGSILSVAKSRVKFLSSLYLDVPSDAFISSTVAMPCFRSPNGELFWFFVPFNNLSFIFVF
mmetsp:Transcript_17260/g.26151  ORF Transcript_17260/g.26151 Transcript_17260/m.26151 type:complete len:205 (+) Transcript_17260:1711-2325(+)